MRSIFPSMECWSTSVARTLPFLKWVTSTDLTCTKGATKHHLAYISCKTAMSSQNSISHCSLEECWGITSLSTDRASFPYTASRVHAISWVGWLVWCQVISPCRGSTADPRQEASGVCATLMYRHTYEQWGCREGHSTRNTRYVQIWLQIGSPNAMIFTGVQI